VRRTEGKKGLRSVYKELYNVFPTPNIIRWSSGEGSAWIGMNQKIKRAHIMFVGKTKKGIQIKIIRRKQE
jgi:hypothetical protein